MLIPIDASAVDISIEVDDGTEAVMTEIEGIEEIEASVSKDEEDIRTLGDLWQKMRTSQMGIEISLGGHFVEDDAGEMDDGLAELMSLLYSGDDVGTFEFDVPGASEADGAAIETKFRVSDGSESSSFADKVDWSVTLQSYGDPGIGAA